MMADIDMDGLILYLKQLLSRRFSAKVSQIYYGDIGVYLPASFGGSRKDQKAVLALSPVYDREMPDQRVAAHESRLLGVDIIALVNITPFFQANPTEAYGEQMLVKLIGEIRDYLALGENVTLQERVQYCKVGDIDWNWTPRGDQAIRGAALAFEARIRIPRI
jgi:hypothetical protein